MLSSNLSSSSEIRLVKDSESNVTGMDIKASTVDNIAPEDHCNRIARSIVQMLSVAAITRIDTHLTGYEGMPRTPGRLGRASKRVRIIYNIKGVPVKTNKLDLSDINTQSLMIFDRSNKLEQLNNAVSHLFDGRPADSITEAFKIIDGNAKSIRGYHKYACIRNILTHDKLYQHVKKDFTKYFPHKHSAFDFKDYVPPKNIIILNLQSPKTKLTLEKVARDLIRKVKKISESIRLESVDKK